MNDSSIERYSEFNAFFYRLYVVYIDEVYVKTLKKLKQKDDKLFQLENTF